MDKKSTCFFTGHREIPAGEVERIKRVLEEIIITLQGFGTTDFVCGGAIGFDTLAAQTVEKMRKVLKIRLHIIVPCRDQHKYFSPNQKAEYERLLESADSVEVLCEHYTRGCMHARNRKMADMSDTCIAYCTSDKGGTAYTVNYATKKGIKVIYI